MKRMLCVVLLPLVGCAGVGRSPQEIQAADPTTACMNRLQADFFIAKQIGAKIAIVGEPDMQQMADRTKPQGEQLAAISSYANTKQQCWALGASYRRYNIPDQVVGVLDAHAQSGAISLSKLYAGELTFGEYNTQAEETRMSFRAKLLQIEQAIAQNDANRRAAVVLPQQPYITPAYQVPIRRQTTCTSQRIGQQVYTNCN
jgi:hypothetical protein